jgi:anti-sigma regulatory factor (Ser/Thr protein kinase)
MHLEKSFTLLDPSDTSQTLKNVLSWVEAFLSRLPVTEETRWAPLLCVEEFVTNLLRYGALTHGSQLRIELRVEQQDQMTITIVDTGKFFDINKHVVSPNPNRIGGGGIPLLRGLAKIRQWKDHHLNVTELTCKLTPLGQESR